MPNCIYDLLCVCWEKNVICSSKVNVINIYTVMLQIWPVAVVTWSRARVLAVRTRASWIWIPLHVFVCCSVLRLEVLCDCSAHPSCPTERRKGFENLAKKYPESCRFVVDYSASVAVAVRRLVCTTIKPRHNGQIVAVIPSIRSHASSTKFRNYFRWNDAYQQITEHEYLLGSCAMYSARI